LRARKRKVREIWIVEESEYSDAIEEIRELAREQKVSVRPVAAGRLQREAHSESPQGVLARAAEIEPVTLVELAKKVKGVEPFLVVLDGLTDPHNVGAVMRSAALAGATGIVLPRHRSANITPTVAKAAAGAIEYLPMALVGGVANALKELADNGVWSLGLDANGETSLFSDDVTRFATGSVAVVVGAEGSGLSSLVRRRCDVVVSIPQTAVIDSLNASVAAGVACFDIARRRALA
jgi:23S rRNA (guanosine2251-2'-O)-methyltransferase